MIPEDNFVEDKAEFDALASTLDTPSELKELEVEFEDFVGVPLSLSNQVSPELSGMNEQSIIMSLLQTLETALELITEFRRRGFDEPEKVAKLEGLAIRARDLLARIEIALASVNRKDKANDKT